MKTSPSLLREPRGRPVILPQWPRAKRPSLSRCIDFCLANAAELRAPCSARSIHNFGGCAFIHKFRFFVKNFFSFQNFFIFLSAICLLASLSEFRWRCLTEISLRLSTFDAPVNTCNIRLRLRMSCDRKAESMTAFDLARHTFPNAARTRAGVNGISVSDLEPRGRSASL